MTNTIYLDLQGAGVLDIRRVKVYKTSFFSSVPADKNEKQVPVVKKHHRISYSLPRGLSTTRIFTNRKNFKPTFKPTKATRVAPEEEEAEGEK